MSGIVTDLDTEQRFRQGYPGPWIAGVATESYVEIGRPIFPSSRAKPRRLHITVTST
jgi:hypothetical protein